MVTGRVRFAVLLAAAVVAAAAAPAVAARGTWYDPYLDGVEALEKGDPARAIELFETALARRPESGYHRTYGTNYIHYAPHAHLALALGALGRCDAALAEIGRARTAGEPEDDPSLAPRLEALAQRCAPAPEPEPAPPEELSAAAIGPSGSPPAAPPPAPAIDRTLLRRGLAAYLAGDLDTATRVFEQAASEAPDSAVAHLLVATVRFARWRADGRRDEALARSVRSALDNARRLDPLLEPPPALCPPELVARWRTLR
ncbi:MAG: hypothetical protein D6738_08365 [Acidobacteria bacterium]|nr:MAG: hypothetical protein D6738_08365 [Acidobacteriota bacterium]